MATILYYATMYAHRGLAGAATGTSCPLRLPEKPHDPLMTFVRADPILPMMRYAEVKPAWIICRKLQAIPVDDDAALLRLAERGRVRPDDYVVNRRLDVCVQAKEIAEVAAILHNARVRRLRRI